MVGVAQLVRASVCGTEGRGFETPRSPKTYEVAGQPVKSWSDTSTSALGHLHCYFSLGTSSSMAEQWTLNPLVLGSNPRGCTINCSFQGYIPCTWEAKP